MTDRTKEIVETTNDLSTSNAGKILQIGTIARAALTPSPAQEGSDKGTYIYACQLDEVLRHIGESGWQLWLERAQMWVEEKIDPTRINHFLMSRGPGETFINVVAYGPELPEAGLCTPIIWKPVPPQEGGIAEVEKRLKLECDFRDEDVCASPEITADIRAVLAELSRLSDALERIALLDEADGHELTVRHAHEAVAIATSTLGEHPAEIYARRARALSDTE